jgi:hypothetical protein
MTHHVLRYAAIAATFVGILPPFSTCYAARIYNEMSVPIKVDGNFGVGVTINPGQRSDSLNWPSTAVGVTWANRQLCMVPFGFHQEIQGGNYMIVAPIPGGTSCVVCDSNHSRLAGSGDCN